MPGGNQSQAAALAAARADDSEARELRGLGLRVQERALKLPVAGSYLLRGLAGVLRMTQEL